MIAAVGVTDLRHTSTALDVAQQQGLRYCTALSGGRSVACTLRQDQLSPAVSLVKECYPAR